MEPTRTRRTVTGLGLIIGATLLGLLAMTALPWFRDNLGGFLAFGTKVSDLRQTISFYRSAPDIYDVIGYGVSPVYFAWLALVLLILAALLGAATIGFDPRASRLVGRAAAVVALAGVVLTALAIQVVDIDADRLERATGASSNPPGYLDFVGNSSFGAWVMVLAYVGVGVGALLASGGRESIRTLLADEPEPADGPAGPAGPDDGPGGPVTPPVEKPVEKPVERENW